MPFHVLSKLFRVHKTLLGPPRVFVCLASPGFFFQYVETFVFLGIPQPGKMAKTKLNFSFCSGHLKHQGVDGTRRHEWPPVPVSHKAGKEAREEHDEDGWGIGREIEYFGK